MSMATLLLLGLVTMMLGLAAAGPVLPSKPTPPRTGCRIGIFQSLSLWELEVSKKGKDALVRCCYHNGLPSIFPTGMRMAAWHCGLTSDLLLPARLESPSYDLSLLSVMKSPQTLPPGQESLLLLRTGPCLSVWANLCLSLQEERLLWKDVQSSTSPFPSSQKLEAR